jgi:quercetin dioxygenase-like cupin family protein
MRSSIGWAGPARGEMAVDPAVSASSDRVFLGSTALPPGNAHVPHAHPFTEHYVVVSGRAAVLGDATSRALEPLDYVGFQPGEVHGLRAVGTEPLRLLWLQEEIRPEGGGSEYGER